MESFDVQYAINISVPGMLIVFFGLLFISIYIWLLPKVLGLLSKKDIADKTIVNKTTPAITSEPITEEFDSDANDIASVIGLVLNFEQERLAIASEHITIARSTGQQSIWGTAGKMRSMPRRRTHA